MTGKERIGMGEVRGKGKSESHSKIFVIIIQPRNKNTRSIGVTFFLISRVAFYLKVLTRKRECLLCPLARAAADLGSLIISWLFNFFRM